MARWGLLSPILPHSAQQSRLRAFAFTFLRVGQNWGFISSNNQKGYKAKSNFKTTRNWMEVLWLCSLRDVLLANPWSDNNLVISGLCYSACSSIHIYGGLLKTVIRREGGFEFQWHIGKWMVSRDTKSRFKFQHCHLISSPCRWLDMQLLWGELYEDSVGGSY